MKIRTQINILIIGIFFDYKFKYMFIKSNGNFNILKNKNNNKIINFYIFINFYNCLIFKLFHLTF